jgi:hypothetical protein
VALQLDVSDEKSDAAFSSNPKGLLSAICWDFSQQSEQAVDEFNPPLLFQDSI